MLMSTFADILRGVRAAVVDSGEIPPFFGNLIGQLGIETWLSVGDVWESDKLLVFCASENEARELQRRVPESFVLTGYTEPKDVSTILQQFNQCSRGILLTTSRMLTGVRLDKGATVVFSPNRKWSRAEKMQGRARVHRFAGI